MRFFRSLLSALFSLTLVAGLLPSASVFAGAPLFQGSAKEIRAFDELATA